MYKKLFSKATMILMIAGIAINILLVWIADMTGVPLYLDSVGTVIAGALGGVLPGIAVGFFSNLATAFMAVTPDPMTMYYAFLNVLIGVAAALISHKGLFRKWSGRLLSVGVFALIGGAIGSVVTWVLYGFSFGQGISAPFAEFLYGTFHFGEFSAQFTADMGIDIADKLVTVAVLCVVIKLIPGNTMTKLPLGAIYTGKSMPDAVTVSFEDLREKKLFRRRSIRTKIIALILGTTAFISVIGLIISCATYKNRLVHQYSVMCDDSVSMMLPKINGDKIEDYLEQGEAIPEYTETEKDLYDILNNSDKLKYMYVYQILEDGCHVVFDLDSDGLEGEALGTLVPFDESFPYIDETIAGKEIPSVITNDTYGWLLTVYKPIENSAGKVVAYAAADIDMQQIRTDMYAFGISIASLLFGVMIIITAFTLWYCDKKLLEPMSVLAEQARNLDYNGENPENHVRDRMTVSTGDEIEEVFRAMCRTEDAIENNISQLKNKNFEISCMQRNIIYTLANMVENRDGNTGGHIKRTAAYVKLIGQRLYDDGLYPDIVNEDYIRNLHDSAPLHDIGKVKIPDAILNKPGKLTDEEYELMKTHTTEGSKILRSSLSDIEDGSWLSMAVDMAQCHHERWDGKGYPGGLTGEDIPLCARIMAVSDVFDALVSQRSYKEAYPFEESMKIILEGSGTQFDPQIVQAFSEAENEIQRIAGSF